MSDLQLRRILAGTVYLALLGFIVATFDDYGISWDEEFYLESGAAYLDHFFDMIAFANVVAATHLETHGSFFDGVYVLLLRSLNRMGDYETLHLLKALVSSSVVLLVYGLLARLQRNALVPAVGMGLLVFLPAWLGQIFDAHMDGAATLLYGLQLAYGSTMLQLPDALPTRWARPVARVAGLGVLAGLSFSHRVPLVAVSASVLLLWSFQATSARRRICALAFALVFAASLYATVFAVDPYVRVTWGTGLFDKLFFAANPRGVSQMLVLFDGTVTPTSELPRSFVFRWIGISVPVVTLFLAALGMLRLTGWFARPESPRERLNAAFVGLSLLLPLGAVLVAKPIVFDGWRHVLFLSVPLVVVAALGFGWLAERLPGRAARALLPLLAIALVPVALAMGRLHPYEYVYVNELAGGLAATEGRYENDYWAKSYKAAAEWVAERARAVPSRSHSVYVCGPAQAASYYFAQNMQLTDDAPSADYIICFDRPGWSGWAPRSRPDYRIEREGVALTRIWAREPGRDPTRRSTRRGTPADPRLREGAPPTRPR